MDPDQTAPIGAVCSGSTLFASIPNSSVMLGNYLQQTTAEMFKKNLCQTAWTQFRLLLFAYILKLVSNVRQLFAADDFSRRHFQMHFFHGALRVNQSMFGGPIY